MNDATGTAWAAECEVEKLDEYLRRTTEERDRYRTALVEILKHNDCWKRVQETAEKALGGT